MANPQHSEILQSGVESWNEWRRDPPRSRPDLSGEDLSEENLNGADLRRANLVGTNLRGADLNKANVSGADLRGANLVRANLRGADLRRANLCEANLCDADLSWANLNRANLSGAALRGTDLNMASLKEVDLSNADVAFANLREADLSEADLSGTRLTTVDLGGAHLWLTIVDQAEMGWTTLTNVNLSAVRGLESVSHVGPSSIGIDTVYKSQGKIPDVFLRGCGVPDSFIKSIAALTAQPGQYYSCFISYSAKDEDFATRLHADLQENGVLCWLACVDLKIGDEVRSRIDEAIRLHDKLMLILSKHSIDSEWVKDEVETAYERERQEGLTILFPIRLDESVMDTTEAWAAKLRRQRNIGDFTHWKDDDQYEIAFYRLMRDLQASE